jgi:hypothetical protein
LLYKELANKNHQKYTMRYICHPSSKYGDVLMTRIADNYGDYKNGFSSIEDVAGTGWQSKITINEPSEVNNIRPNEPIDFFFKFSEEEDESSRPDGTSLKPSKWHVFAEVPFKAGLEKVSISKNIISDEREREYYRSIPLDNDLQKKHIIDALDKAHDAFEKFFSEKGEQFLPDEDFKRDIYYVEIIEIKSLWDKVKIDDLKIRKERLVNLIDRELYEAGRYKTIRCDVFCDGQLHGSYWSEDEAEYELFLLTKADYFRNEDYYHKYFDTFEEAEFYRKLTFVNSFLGEGPEAITSTENIIRVAKFKEERVKKYTRNIEKYLDTCG